MMNIFPSIVRYAGGASRGSPDLAPVVVSRSSVAPSNGPPTLPPLARNSSTIFALNAFMVSASGISVMPALPPARPDLFRVRIISRHAGDRHGWQQRFGCGDGDGARRTGPQRHDRV